MLGAFGALAGEGCRLTDAKRRRTAVPERTHPF